MASAQQTRSEAHRAAYLKWRDVPPGIPAELADEFMRRLIAGETLRTLTQGGKKCGPALVTSNRFKKHCELHPDWGADAMRLARQNAKAADALKSPKRYRRLCKYGHELDSGRIYFRYGYMCRRCRQCDKLRNARAGVIKPGDIARVSIALQNGVTVSQIMHGRPAGGGPRNRSLILINPVAFYRYRRQNPEFNRFVLDAIEKRICASNPVLAVAPGTFRYEWDPADAHLIPDMLPDHFPGKNDVVQSIFVELIEGRLDRSRLKQHIKSFLKDYYRQHPVKFAKFGKGLLVSLDEAQFDDGGGKRSDNVVHGLWD